MLDALRRFPAFKIFRRQSELTAPASATKQVGGDVGARLRDASGTPVPELLAQLGTTPLGLTNAEAEERLEKYGLNRVASERPPRWYVQLGHSITNPFVLLLLVLAAVSLVAGDIQVT
ncbi:MAG TPA: cation-transporting P-type ATPase, partial [Myxococcaceae bacterium]|nr:cation-transporting P-type ATPase [Myxococcaceae bacterium]